MNETSGRRWEEGPRVRVKARVVPRGDPVRTAVEALRARLADAEHRFLALLSRIGQGISRDVLVECLEILAELREVAARLHEMAGRRDISYFADLRLTALRNHCLWLARRTSGEFLLLLQIHFEATLRRLIGPNAYQIYLRLEDVEDVAREVETMSDHDLLGRLRDGTLLRENVEQTLPADLPGTSVAVGYAAGEENGPS
jgi:hypothetical protein